MATIALMGRWVDSSEGYEVFGEMVVNDGTAPPWSRTLDAVFVSQCHALHVLDPHDGELMLLAVDRLEPDPDDARRCLAFGVYAALAITREGYYVEDSDTSETSCAALCDTYNAARNVPR